MKTSLAVGDLPDQLVDVVMNQPQVAVDTETSGLDWRSNRLETCQIFTPATGAIVVQRPRSGAQNLSRVLEYQKNIKVFHFAPFDLRFLAASGISARNVACTKAASKLLSPLEAQEFHSLASLARQYLGVELEKGAVRTSDWGAAVLSKEQLEYAVDDVAHLLKLYGKLTSELHDHDLTELYRAICAYMPYDAALEVAGVPNPLQY